MHLTKNAFWFKFYLTKSTLPVLTRVKPVVIAGLNCLPK